MSLRQTHFIGISEGHIELRFAGDEETARPQFFSDELSAAKALVEAMTRTKVDRVLSSSSVNWPADDGMPGFDMDRFNELVRKNLQPEGLETPRMLVLSTRHITGATDAMFRFSTDDVPQFFPKVSWGEREDPIGWLIPIVGNEPFPHTCPADLLAIRELADLNGCTWIMLDRDGPLVPSLPEYDW